MALDVVTDTAVIKCFHVESSVEHQELAVDVDIDPLRPLSNDLTELTENDPTFSNVTLNTSLSLTKKPVLAEHI